MWHFRRLDVRVLGRRYGAVLLLALVAAVVAIGVNTHLFPLFSADDDDTVYVFQARTLVDGHVTLPAATQGAFFRPWLTGTHGDRIVFPFQYGWPAVLAAAQRLLGSMRWALGAVAGGLVVASWMLARELLRDRSKALLASGFVLASPFVVIQSGTYLSYAFALLLEVLFGFLLLRGLRLRSWPYLVASGLFLGLVVLTRPFDGVLIAIPFGIYAVVAHRRRPRRLVVMGAWVLLGFAGPMAIGLILNAHLTGSPLTFPEATNGGIQQFGFGSRRLAAGTNVIDYSLGRALRSFWSNIVALPQWFFGGLVAVAFAIACVVRKRRQPEYLLLAGLAIVFPLGYILWWGSTLSVTARNSIGPHYYLPSVIPVAILAAALLGDVWRSRRAIAVGGAAVMVLTTGLVLPGISSKTTAIRDNFERGHRVIAAAHLSNALVILPRDEHETPYVLHPIPYLQNRPDLTGRVLYASEHGPDDLRLLARYSRRAPYRFAYVVPEGGDIFHPALRLTPLSVTRSPEIAVRLRARAPAGSAPGMTAYVTDGHRIAASVPLDTASGPDATHDVEYRVSPTSVTIDNGAATTTQPLPPSGVLRFGVAFGPGDFTDGERFERRVPYKSSKNGMELLLPAEQWHRWVYPSVFWIQERGHRIITDFSVTTTPPPDPG
ncbi:MAG: glycosyltransferase family 39 protein [Actinomycetota bacterium]|nr:glycosyltransferase family 39 protein [Actinomycetota bacterium]